MGNTIYTLGTSSPILSDLIHVHPGALICTHAPGLSGASVALSPPVANFPANSPPLKGGLC